MEGCALGIHNYPLNGVAGGKALGQPYLFYSGPGLGQALGRIFSLLPHFFIALLQEELP
jgi:hypothetical protein